MAKTMIGLMKCAVLAAAISMTGCQTNTATGRSQLNMLSTGEEISIGNQTAPQYVEQFGGEVDDPVIREYVADLGSRLTSTVVVDSGRQSLPWEFFTVDSKMINAFALPGGKIFITRGLLEKMDNEAQLVSVLGHEIGHVTGKHIGEQLTQQMLLQVGLGAAAAATDSEWVAVMGGVAGGFAMLKFSRSHETESDDLGLRYMTSVGYDPMGMLQVMEIFKAESGGGGVEFLQTHPLPQTRIDRIRRLIGTRYAHTQNNSEFTLGEASFLTNVTERLEALPPARHDPAAEAAEAGAGNAARGGGGR